jgi:hypothetical protein
VYLIYWIIYEQGMTDIAYRKKTVRGVEPLAGVGRFGFGSAALGLDHVRGNGLGSLL